MLDTPFSPWPSYTEEEIDVVSAVLTSKRVNYWTGKQCQNFEKEFANWAQTEYAVALANGTIALEFALRALGLGPGDEVIVTSRTFIGSVSAIVNIGATPVFTDVDINSGNINAEAIESGLNERSKAVVCVHLAGWPCEMDSILNIARKYGLFVVEDCAQAHGAQYRGQPVGSIGHIGCWSFCQDKIMSTGGEGGMVTTNNRDLFSQIWSYKDHGKSWDTVFKQEHSSGFRWLHESFGTNGRMTEMQAAIGRIQLDKITEWTNLRQANSEKIDSVCRKLDSLRVPDIPIHVRHARYKHYVFVRPDTLKAGWGRDRITDEINRGGVPCFQGSCSEVYLEKAFDNTGFRPKGPLPVAKELGETSLMFLVHPTLTNEELQKTCDVIEQVMEKATIT